MTNGGPWWVGSIVALLVAACGREPVAVAPPPRATCTLDGAYVHETEDVGRAELRFTQRADGTFAVTESGLSNFAGTGRLADGELRVDFTTDNGFSGTYTWRLDPGCSRGQGTLVFRSGGTGSHGSTLARAPGEN